MSERARQQAFDETLREGILVLPPQSSSMWPMLRARRDSVLLAPPAEPPAAGDVALYRDTDGNLVLHRVIARRGGEIVLRGDRNLACDAPVPAARIVAVMRGFYRGERYIDARAPLYRLYARVWPRLPGWIRRALIASDRRLSLLRAGRTR